MNNFCASVNLLVLPKSSFLNEEIRTRVLELIDEKAQTRIEVRKIIKHLKEDSDPEIIVSYRSNFKTRESLINRTLARCKASLKLNMMRFDDILDGIHEDEWMLKELLIQHRLLIHQPIDNLMKMKKNYNKCRNNKEY